MLEINNVSYAYSRKAPKVLDGFSLSLAEGGVYGLLGPNGAGKSTLLNIIAGALTPATGSVKYDGVNTRLRLPDTMAEIFIVPEEFNLPAMTLLNYARRYGALYPRFSLERMLDHLKTFEITGNPRLDALSMGQKKKVFMSFAMACDTRILLMDEPTNGLDIPGKAAFRRFVAQNMADDRIFIISTHQVRDIDRLLDHIIIMDRHRVIFNPSVADIQSRLIFTETNNRDIANSAIHAIPSIAGASVILPNTDNSETAINLELLFDLALRKPDTLNSMFNDKNDNEL